MGASTIVGRCTFSMTAGGREALARAGDAEQGLEPVAPLDPGRERGDRLGLVARGGQIGDELERRHQEDANGGV